MLKSMTGYSRHEYTEDNITITVEIKSVNSRYLELNVRLPKVLSAFEIGIRNAVKNRIKRGRIEMSVFMETGGASLQKVTYDKGLAVEYLNALQSLQEDFPGVFKDEISINTFARFEGILKSNSDTEGEEEKLNAILLKTVERAIELFDEDRIREGKNLYDDLGLKLDNIKVNLDKIVERAPENVSLYRESLRKKLEEVVGTTGLDENRIATEAVIYADKICVDEETVRLASHIQAMRAELEKNESVGKKLDFLAQEMNREANTILSKSIDLKTTDYAIDIKTDIEKVREQIQNVE